jgi:carboxyl-terminal processing protease
MPRRNLYWVLAVSVAALVCYQKVQQFRYGRILVDAMDQVQRRALEEVDESDLFEGAMQGMMHKLGDRYSEYLPPKKQQEMNAELDQQFGGLGIEIAGPPQTKQLQVIVPLPGTPAARAGIRSGDTIVRIDDRDTQGMAVNEAADLMRGEAGTKVTLTVLHEGDKEPVKIELVREVIHVESVQGDARNADGSWNFFLAGKNRIGYIRIRHFGKDTGAELKEALNGLAARGMRGLVLDLRDNPGGLLSAAVEVCNQFIAEGTIVTIQRRDGRPASPPFEADGKGTFLDFPLAVIVNGESASASEIVAACLQDNQHRAKIVGQRTFGKGTVQEILELAHGTGALKLTTARYGRPNGKNINRGKNDKEGDEWGVQPDDGCRAVIEPENYIKLKMQRLRRDINKRNGTPPAGNDETIVDTQLNRAVEVVEEALE